jgi:hypothetical protein
MAMIIGMSILQSLAGKQYVTSFVINHIKSKATPGGLCTGIPPGSFA